jgi:hypothetical protein
VIEFMYEVSLVQIGAKNRRKQPVRRFYEVLWDAHDKDAIPTVLHETFTFRGSLGQEKRGRDGFAESVDKEKQDDRT